MDLIVLLLPSATFVWYMYAGCLSGEITIAPDNYVPIGPISGVTRISYTVQPDLNLLTTLYTTSSSSGSSVTSKIFEVVPDFLFTLTITGLSPKSYYWIHFQHNDIRNDSTLTFFNLNDPSGKHRCRFLVMLQLFLDDC